MARVPVFRPAALALALPLLHACAGGSSGPRVVQPGAPGQQGTVVDASAARAAMPSHTEADVHFMSGMIPHHGQALEMVALAP